MGKFEVHIPASDSNGFSVTLKVGADNWMNALKAGLQKLGEQGAVSQNVMVDIQDDNSYHVTEPASGRVFRIRELSEEEVARAQVKRPSGIRPGVKTDPAGAPAKGQTVTQPATPSSVSTEPPVGSDTAKTLPGVLPAQLGLDAGALARPAPQAAVPYRRSSKSSPRIEVKDVEELVQPVVAPTGAIGRARSSPNVERTRRQETEDILADIFIRVVDINGKKTIEEAMDFILDLALEKVPCEAGSVMRADTATGDLTFISARGPKATELIASKMVIPAGSGLAGFCASEGVSVAVNDVQKDPRYYAEVADRVGYETKSLLCSPMMTHGHSFGCMQVINRKGGATFLEHEVGVLSYLAHQAALFLNQKLLE